MTTWNYSQSRCSRSAASGIAVTALQTLTLLTSVSTDAFFVRRPIYRARQLSTVHSAFDPVSLILVRQANLSKDLPMPSFDSVMNYPRRSCCHAAPRYRFLPGPTQRHSDFARPNRGQPSPPDAHIWNLCVVLPLCLW